MADAGLAADADDAVEAEAEEEVDVVEGNNAGVAETLLLPGSSSCLGPPPSEWIKGCKWVIVTVDVKK